MSDKRPIIIIKKKVNHAGHHGGAWKVAYADFVTAMMALFIVLWLTSSGEKVKKSIASYFNDPAGTVKELGTGQDGTGDSIPLDKKGISELKEKMERQIASRPDLSKLHNQVDIIITPEGMRVELMESKDGTFFQTGKSNLNPLGKEMLGLLAKELSTAPNRVSIEGHTDAQPYGVDSRYDNWELSTDRANAARRLMQSTGLQPNQLAQVRGFADQQLRLPANPLDPSNRRISVIVHYAGFIQTNPRSTFAGTAQAVGGAKIAVAAAAGSLVKPNAAKSNRQGVPDAKRAEKDDARADVPSSALKEAGLAAPESQAPQKSTHAAMDNGKVLPVSRMPAMQHIKQAIPTVASSIEWFRKMTASLMPHKAAKVPASAGTKASTSGDVAEEKAVR